MKNEVSVACVFTGNEDANTILQQSFDLYLTRILAEQNGFVE
jgi:hypothetical protein